MKNTLLILGILGIVLLVATFAFLFYMRVAGPYLNQARIVDLLQTGKGGYMEFGMEAVPDYWPSVFGCEEITSIVFLPEEHYDFSEEDIQLMKSLPGLVFTCFAKVAFPEEAMKRYLDGREFEAMFFCDTNLNDEMLSGIAAQPKMYKLELSRNAVSETAVVELLTRCPDVTNLVLMVADHPDATLVELAKMLSEYVPVSDSTVDGFLKHLKISWKKRRSAPPNNTGRTSSSSGRTGKCCKNCSTGKNSFSSMKRGPKRT